MTGDMLVLHLFGAGTLVSLCGCGEVFVPSWRPPGDARRVFCGDCLVMPANAGDCWFGYGKGLVP